MKASTTFQIYPDAGGKYRWRAKAKNGRVTATSGESFDSLRNALKAAVAFAKSVGVSVSFKVLPMVRGEK